VCTCLARSDWLAERVAEVDGYFVVRGREALMRSGAIGRRLPIGCGGERGAFVRVLRALPFVRMIGITGALAMRKQRRRR
jgi:hypothetical protein